MRKRFLLLIILTSVLCHGECPSPCPLTSETGTHWASRSDFADLKKLDYKFVVMTVGREPQEWEQLFDSAAEWDLKLIVGLWPHPYRLQDGRWVITSEGKAFLDFARERAGQVKALFVFNEPYWVHPITGANNFCGAVSADSLRALREEIRSYWPEAKIYHDLGWPSVWAPGGELRQDYPCIGDKYVDATGIADYVGIWTYPFKAAVYARRDALRKLGREVSYVRTEMRAEPVILGQAFRCTDCSPNIRWPELEEIQEWNCSIRLLRPAGISWYVWRFDLYDEDLSMHPEAWEATTARSCSEESKPSGP